MYFLLEKVDIPASYVSLPEGIIQRISSVISNHTTVGIFRGADLVEAMGWDGMGWDGWMDAPLFFLLRGYMCRYVFFLFFNIYVDTHLWNSCFSKA